MRRRRAVAVAAAAVVVAMVMVMTWARVRVREGVRGGEAGGRTPRDEPIAMTTTTRTTENGEKEFDVSPRCASQERNRFWCKDSRTGVFRFFLPGERFVRKTWRGAVECLAGKHVVLIGDSRTRYQYASLAHFLVHKQWPRCPEDGGQLDDAFVGHAATASCQWLRGGKAFGGDWNEYHAWLTAELTKTRGDDDEGTTSREWCDCFRPNKPRGTAPDVWVPENVENRHFALQTVYGHVRITVIVAHLAFAWMHTGFPPFSNPSTSTSVAGGVPCAPGACTRAAAPATPQLHIREVIRTIVPMLNPTHVFAQAGWWEDDVGCELVELERRHRNVTAFAMTGLDRFGPTHNGERVNPPVGCGAKVFDRLRLSRLISRGDWLDDDVHVGGAVNEELNHRLMGLVCPPPPGT